MKNMIYVLLVLAFAGTGLRSFAQVEVKGTGTTGATKTFETKNNNNVSSMFIRDDGNIGIKTTTPGYPLDVNGIIRTNAGIKFPDSSYLTSARSGNVFTVSPAGGDFTTITAALNATGPAVAGNVWLIRVMPGVYNENVTCKQYVHLGGAGKYVTTINGTVTAANFCVIEDFYITQGIQCIGTSPTIMHNRITNMVTSGDGILVTLGGKPWIKENEISNCLGWGISSFDAGSDFWAIGNKIISNGTVGGVGSGGGGIFCNKNSPTISNNTIDYNHWFGIEMLGVIGFPTEPTVDDNVIGHTDENTGGIGIYMSGYAEPRIISNDIYVNDVGIFVNQVTQPSIIGNDINYNRTYGIYCNSQGATKRVVITGNHIHSSARVAGGAGIKVFNANPMITLNNITQNDPNLQFPDIDYSTCAQGQANNPMISLNVYDIILRSATGASGNFNVTSNGLMIAP
jgi:parallel beta-helix repeat protein